MCAGHILLFFASSVNTEFGNAILNWVGVGIKFCELIIYTDRSTNMKSKVS